MQTQWKFLDHKPGSLYRQLFVKGHRIAAFDLFCNYMNEGPQSFERVAAEYDLPVEVVEEAISYCESNPPEIEEDWEREQASLRASGRIDPESRWFGSKPNGANGQHP